MNDPTKSSRGAVALLALAATLALLAVPALGLAQSDPAAAGPHSPAAHFGMHLQHLTQKLNLTAEQQATAKQMAQDLAAKMAPIHQAQKALHTQLKAALTVPNPDAATVGQVVIQMHQNRAQVKSVMDAFHQQFEALLNPDQLAQYKQMLAAHSAFRHHGAGFSNPSQ
ncbi:MAG: periplasmic heavy metal sensor [Acidobacteria bacterium]|nr:periplasmic heavy metal sensor [Acidobacteriota bacterium]